MKWNLPSIIHLRDSKVSWRVSNNNFWDQIYHRVVLGLKVYQYVVQFPVKKFKFNWTVVNVLLWGLIICWAKINGSLELPDEPHHSPWILSHGKSGASVFITVVIQDVVTVPVSMATVSASVLGAGSVTLVARLDSVSIVERRHNSPSEMGILKGVTISPCELGYIAELLPIKTSRVYMHIHSARVYIPYRSRNELWNFTT